MLVEHATMGAPFIAQIVVCSSVVITGASVSMQSPALGSEIDLEEKEYDIYRDSILRYAGYFNEVRELVYEYPWKRFVLR